MNPTVKLTATAAPGDKSYVLFIGAGLSKDAGLHTTWDLMLETAKLLFAGNNPGAPIPETLSDWFEESAYAETDYASLIAELFPSSVNQQKFLEEYLGDRQHGEAHKLVAELARREIIRCIVTPNFDHCLATALLEAKVPYQTISTEEDLMA